MLKELAPAVVVLARLDSVEATIHWWQENPPPDLILLAIHLADGASFELFEHVQIKCPVIFTMAYDEYALRAFKVNAVDYLLKPIKINELAAALDKYSRVFAPPLPDAYGPGSGERQPFPAADAHSFQQQHQLGRSERRGLFLHEG